MNTHDDDDNEDLSGLDRGDELDTSDKADGGAAAADAGKDEGAGGEAEGATAGADAGGEGADGEVDAGAADAEAAVAAAEQAVADAKAAGDAKGGKNLELRLAKALLQRDEAIARLEALEAARAADEKPSPIDAINAELDELYEKVEAARADADVKAAAQLQRQIDAKNRQLTVLEAESVTDSRITQFNEDARYDAMLDTLEKAMPELNPKSEAFDQDAVNQLNWQVAAHERAGMRPTMALERAVMLLFKVNPLREAAKPVAAAAPPKKDDAKPLDRKKIVADALERASKTPPAIDGKGANTDSTKINVADLDDDDFEKLPESKKAQLRGDYL